MKIGAERFVRAMKISLCAAVAILAILAIGLIAFHKPALRAANVLAAWKEGAKYDDLVIRYPLTETLFPPEIAAPQFRWKDSNPNSDVWVVRLQFEDREDSLSYLTRAQTWTPSDADWEAIKRRSLEKNAKVTVVGVSHSDSQRILSSGTIAIRTSKDEVGAPLFYREVNLPFVDAVKDPSRIRWRFGEISTKGAPPVVLESMPVCGNCHSFSADGSTMGMDVDYANDKGSYIISGVEPQIILAKSKVITWSDYRREDKQLTYGLLSQLSPDGRYAVSTVKDRSVFVPKEGLAFSQLFFPVKGILAFHRRDSATFKSLHGADDPQYVQSNPAWSPDGKYIAFARSKAYQLKSVDGKVLLTPEECKEFLKEGKTFLFDLYRVPFNEGQGGAAEPIEGASNNGMSNFFAKYSPDGKWIVFCKAASFMLLQPDSQLYIVPAGGGPVRRMRCNTSCMNSWHTWSPNSRWLAFASKTNGPYTQLFLTHVDAEGNDTPAVLLDRFTSSDRAANIPEFVHTSPRAIKKIHEQFVDDLSFLRAANEFVLQNDAAGAADALRKALKVNPGNPVAHCDLGFILKSQGQFEEAVLEFSEAVRLKPDYVQARQYLGDLLVEQRKIPEAQAQFAEAVRLDPSFVAARNNLGLLLANQGDIRGAIAQFTEVVRLKPDYVQAHQNLGVSLARLGEMDKALSEFAEAVRLDPNFATAQCCLGLALAQQGRTDEAIVHLQHAIEIRPDYEEARINLQRLRANQPAPPSSP